MKSEELELLQCIVKEKGGGVITRTNLSLHMLRAHSRLLCSYSQCCYVTLLEPFEHGLIALLSISRLCSSCQSLSLVIAALHIVTTNARFYVAPDQIKDSFYSFRHRNRIHTLLGKCFFENHRGG